MKWFTRNNEKKKYALMITWIRDAETVNKLIQLKIIMKSDIKTMKYYERNCKVKQCIKCQEYDHWIYVCKNKQCCAHYAQKHQFAKYFHQKKTLKWRCGPCKKTHKTFNFQCFRKQMKKERIKIATKIKFMYHAIKMKEVSIAMTFSLALILENIVIWTEKSTKRKTNKSSKKRRFSESTALC